MQAGLLSREVSQFGVPTQSSYAEGHVVGGVIAKSLTDPARSKNLCMHGTFMRENREVPCPPVQ